MPVARTFSVALNGLIGTVVEVEADISPGLPATVVIGLGDTAVSQARDRVRAAGVNAGYPLTTRKLTINLSPAALPKHGSGFDLAMAMAGLAADGAVSSASVAATVHLGELGLDGRLRPISGVLPAVLALARAGHSRVMVPSGNADEACLVPGVTVIPAASLREAAILHGGEFETLPVEPVIVAPEADHVEPRRDLAEVIGNDDAVEALVVAAAGGHHVFMVGPPGAGKTMLAERLPGILPDLEGEAALEVASIRSLAGSSFCSGLPRRPPFEAPHHTATAAAMVGGGSGIIRPGAAVRASHGVLFLDEAPEFSGAVLDSLRQPLESGSVSIHRASGVARFPARFQLVVAANPCPCGQYGVSDVACACPPQARRRYLARLSGPLMDRIDIHLTLRRATGAGLREGRGALASDDARRRVVEARAVARSRLVGTPWSLNAQLPGGWLRESSRRPPRGATAPLDRALERGGITMRGYDRVLRLAWTLADLSGAQSPGADQIGRALYLRRGMAA